MKTSSFEFHELARARGMFPISIASRPPSLIIFRIPVYQPLVPEPWVVDDDVFARLYRRKLAKLDPLAVVDDLLRMGCGQEPCLMSWQGAGEGIGGPLGHRPLVSEWLVEAGFEVEEIVR